LFEFFRQTVFQYHQHSATVGPNSAGFSWPGPAHRGRSDSAADTVSGKIASAESTTRDKHQLSSATSGNAAEQSEAGSRRRRRVLFSREQTVALEEWFERQSYVSATDRDRLATSLSLRPTQVKIWFQNRRYKLKKIRRQMERNRCRMMASSALANYSAAAAAAAAAAAWSLHPGDVVNRRAVIVQPSVVRRIAVPILVRDGRPCFSRAVRHSQC